MLRVIAFGSYKRPRELTWLSGVALLGLILAFALTGYLLPWDQRAYWATVVTINISRLAPGAGDMVAGVLQGGASIGALTLTRWYSAHVIFLPGSRGRHRRRASRADAPQGHLRSRAGARGNTDRVLPATGGTGTSPSSRSSCWRSC